MWLKGDRRWLYAEEKQRNRTIIKDGNLLVQKAKLAREAAERMLGNQRSIGIPWSLLEGFQSFVESAPWVLFSTDFRSNG